MAKAIPLVIGVAAVAVTGGAALGLIAPLAATLITTGLGVVGTLAGALLAETPAKPKMQDGDVSIKQAIPPRTRMYGRQRLGGVYLYYDSTPDGDLKTLVCHAAHECDALEEHWLNDDRVQVEDGTVTDDPWGEFEVVTIIHWPGTPDQTITDIDDDQWTPAHRGRGLCCGYVKYSDLKDEDQVKVFPSGPPPYRAVLRGAKIFDPRAVAQSPAQAPDDETTYAWSDNAALVILDYLTRMEQGVPVGFGISFDSIDLGSFEAAADVCDQEIPIKIEGEVAGVEPRWRAWGAYELTEDRKAVLADLLDACGGRLIQGPDGKLGLTVGAGQIDGVDVAGIPAASVSLNDDQILEYDFSTGKPAIERINEVRATYVSQAWEWAETEAGIQLDQAAIDRNGVESSQIKLRFVPSESQAQRVAKYTLKRGNPTRAGRIRTTLAGLDAWGERWITLTISEIIGFTDILCEITSMRVDRDTMTVEMEVQSYDDWWGWTAETDEQAPAIPPPNSDDDAEVPVPENVAVSIVHRLVNGQTYVAVGLITWDPPPRSVYVAKARYRPLSPLNAPWQPLPVAQDDDQVETFPLEDGVAYEAQVRFIGPRGAGSDWSASANFTAVADPVAPASPVGLTAQANVPATGQVTVSATQANDPRAATLRFYRNSTNTFVGSTILSGMPLYAGPGQSRSVVESPGVGDWYYFATSSNWSSVASAPAGGVLAEVSPATVTITSPTNPTTTNDNRLPVTGTGATAGASIKLYANAVQVGTSTADGSGNWTVTPSTAYGNGVNALTATQTVGGNESAASGAVSLTVNTLDADARVYIDAMTPRPTSARMGDISTLVAALKTAGVWTKLDALYLLAAHDAQAARLNAKAPATFALTANSSPTFTSDRGYAGTGNGGTVGGYLSSGFNPATAGGVLTLNSAHIGIWTDTAPTSAGREVGNTQIRIGVKPAAGQIATRCNDATESTTASSPTDGVGHYLISRTASPGYDKYHNGAVQTAAVVTSTSIASAGIDILRTSTVSYSNARASAAHWGSGLTATEASNLYAALHTYLVAVGAA